MRSMTPPFHTKIQTKLQNGNCAKKNPNLQLCKALTNWQTRRLIQSYSISLRQFTFAAGAGCKALAVAPANGALAVAAVVATDAAAVLAGGPRAEEASGRRHARRAGRVGEKVRSLLMAPAASEHERCVPVVVL